VELELSAELLLAGPIAAEFWLSNSDPGRTGLLSSSEATDTVALRSISSLSYSLQAVLRYMLFSFLDSFLFSTLSMSPSASWEVRVSRSCVPMPRLISGTASWGLSLMVITSSRGQAPYLCRSMTLYSMNYR
jgi:hypothetical protein